ncbi:hypothetical protein AGLY_015069 [Aphis glycines]|uniref:Uncharacterized protein n=1 Tax=Aphis glycines TaxID=307491 RepID=A0A6G0T370_APHGL|nr:hypothetical protein AGLY_015069 [Aphis glycines]
MTNFTRIRLVSDGCAVQNKNSSIVAMVHAWLLSDKAPQHIEEVEVDFSITGHSFLPADRVFGIIEKKLLKFETIAKPETVKDFRLVACTAFKNTTSWPFQISQVIRIFIKRQKTTGNVIVLGEGSYRMDIGVYKSLIQLKKKKEFPGILFNADIVKKTNILPIAKFNDVHKLLEAHFGPECKSNSELKFYTKLRLGNPEEQSDEPDPYCEEVLEDVTETV